MSSSRNNGHPSQSIVRRITEVRSEYTSARLICENLERRVVGQRCERAPGYLPPEIDYQTADEHLLTIQVRDYDVRFLDRVPEARALAHLALIHLARRGDGAARQELDTITRDLHPRIADRFAGADLIENDLVIPYTTDREFPETQISNKGSILLQLSRQGFATPDFNLLAAGVYELSKEKRRACARDAIHNLEKLSGRKLGDPANPLLIAMRSAMPRYLPGFMPTYLNVGLTPELLPGLPRRYGKEAVARIRLSNRRTILETLDPDAFRALEEQIRPDLSRTENDDLSDRLEELIAQRDPRLLDDPHHQVEFFLDQTYEYYDQHFDALRNFMGNEVHYPTLILQRMVCSVIDRESYAGVLYSRHPRLGTGIHLQFARAIYGEDLMTGRLSPEEIHFLDPENARSDFPAVYHFSRRLAHLEKIFAAPVMVEFTGVHGIFTILQVNRAQLSGVGMLTAVMDAYQAGEFDAARVRQLIEPFHIRQIESDAIDPKSLQSLPQFCGGISVLPRSAVSGRIYFSGERADAALHAQGGDNVILVKTRFTPTDAINMQTVHGICSLSPAAIHVVTTAQTLGIPALLDLEKEGVRIDTDGRSLINRDGTVLREGDWVTISSRNKALFVGKAVFSTARLLRFMEGESVELTTTERAMFERLATYYREYHGLLEDVDAGEFESLQALGHSVRSGRFRNEPEKAAEFINRCFDVNRVKLVERLFETTLGMHLSNQSAFRLLSVERRAALLASAVERATARGRTGYQAGSFVIGCLVEPDAPCAFWRGLAPEEIAFLLNEWILHQKYQDILSDVGERRINRAKGVILSQGLGQLHLHTGLVKDFMPLKISGVDLDAVRDAMPDGCDAQTVEMVDLLRQPYGVFYDFSRPDALRRLEAICAAENCAVPGPDDR